MEKRLNHVNTLIGMKGCGKTTYGRRMLSISAMPKKLIVDTIDHPSYRDVSTVNYWNLKGFKEGTARIYGTETELILQAITTQVSNTLVVFEDAAKYLKNNLQPEVTSFIIDSKQKNVDIIFMFHSFGFVPPDLFRLTDSITIFKTKDSPASRKNFLPNFEDINRGWNEVMKSPVKWENRFYETA